MASFPIQAPPVPSFDVPKARSKALDMLVTTVLFGADEAAASMPFGHAVATLIEKLRHALEAPGVVDQCVRRALDELRRMWATAENLARRAVEDEDATRQLCQDFVNAMEALITRVTKWQLKGRMKRIWGASKYTEIFGSIFDDLHIIIVRLGLAVAAANNEKTDRLQAMLVEHERNVRLLFDDARTATAQTDGEIKPMLEKILHLATVSGVPPATLEPAMRAMIESKVDEVITTLGGEVQASRTEVRNELNLIKDGLLREIKVKDELNLIKDALLREMRAQDERMLAAVAVGFEGMGDKVDARAAEVVIQVAAVGGQVSELTDAVKKLQPTDKQIRNISAVDLKYVKLIGDGSCGEVWEAELKGVPVAVKKLRPVLQSDLKFVAALQREAKKLGRLSHPHIVPLFGIVSVPYTGLVLELGDCSLDHLVHNELDDLISEPLATAMLSDAAAGLQYLHSNGMAHRDIKSGNLIVCRGSFIVRLTDFGTLKVFADTGMTATMTGGAVGTTPYMAPELLDMEEDEVVEPFAADWYSWGITCNETLTRERPWAGKQVGQIVRSICKGLRPTMSTDANPNLLQLIHDATQSDPHARPSGSEVCARLKVLLQEEGGDPRRRVAAEVFKEQARRQVVERAVEVAAAGLSPEAEPQSKQQSHQVAYPPDMVAWVKPLKLFADQENELLDRLCGKEYGARDPQDLTDLEPEELASLKNTLPKTKRVAFLRAVDKLQQAEAEAAEKRAREEAAARVAAAEAQRKAQARAAEDERRRRAAQDEAERQRQQRENSTCKGCGHHFCHKYSDFGSFNDPYGKRNPYGGNCAGCGTSYGERQRWCCCCYQFL